MNSRQKFIAYKTILKRELVRLVRIWTQTLLPPIITSTLFFAVFGKLVGARLEGVMGHGTYIEFITPGLILMTIMMNAYENSVASFFIAKFQRSIEELVVSPTPGWVVILGYTTAGIVRAAIVGLVVFIVANCFAPIKIENIGLTIFVALMTSITFALAGLNNAFFAKNFDDISWIPTFVITPLTYLGGVFYSVDIVPGAWRNLVLLNPIHHMITLFRHSFVSSGHIEVWPHILIMATLMVALFASAVYLFEKGSGIKG